MAADEVQSRKSEKDVDERGEVWRRGGGGGGEGCEGKTERQGKEESKGEGVGKRALYQY